MEIGSVNSGVIGGSGFGWWFWMFRLEVDVVLVVLFYYSGYYI